MKKTSLNEVKRLTAFHRKYKRMWQSRGLGDRDDFIKGQLMNPHMCNECNLHDGLALKCLGTWKGKYFDYKCCRCDGHVHLDYEGKPR